MIRQQDSYERFSFNARTAEVTDNSLNEFKTENCDRDATDESIYDGLAAHQQLEAWPARDTIKLLQEWTRRFNAEFKLQLSEIALRIDALPCTRYGHFRVGHNGFGLKGEIALNTRYLQDRPLYQILGTLLHELLHAWQHAYGNPSRRDHHNEEFRSYARSLGLNIDQRGVTGFAADSRFKDLLRQRGIAVPDGEFLPPSVRERGGSKLKKWSCRCTNVRCAIADLRIRCLKCGESFVQCDQ